VAMTKGCVMLLPAACSTSSSLSLATKLVACAPDNNGDIKILKYTPLRQPFAPQMGPAQWPGEKR